MSEPSVGFIQRPAPEENGTQTAGNEDLIVSSRIGYRQQKSVSPSKPRRLSSEGNPVKALHNKQANDSHLYQAAGEVRCKGDARVHTVTVLL